MRTTPARTLPLLALALTAFTGCGDDVIGPVYPEDVEFGPETGVVLSQMTRLESGVYIQTLEGGAGLPVAENSEAVLDYTLWLADGTQIESREGVPFVIGPGRVIDGFYLGMQGAREGETRLIVIPSHLGYGPGGQNAIPGSAVLVFRVHVVSVEPPA